jgi:hydroxyacylglutathione hydrolase
MRLTALGRYSIIANANGIREAMMILKTLVVGRLRTNCYVIGCEETRQAAVIDPGGDARDILAAARDEGLTIGQIILTHFHFDHNEGAVDVQRQTGATLALHRDDVPLLSHPPALFRLYSPAASERLTVDRTLEDGAQVQVGSLVIEVLHVPGHSPGGIALWQAEAQAVFCGDTLFYEGLGRTDFPGADHVTLLRSIAQRLLTLPDETAVYPGHGPSTTVGHERQHNPWLRGALAR